MSIHIVRQTALLVLCASMALGAPEDKRGREKAGPKQPSQNSTCNDVPAHPFDLVLGRPTRDSVTLSVLTYQDTEGRVAYGTERGQLTQQTPSRQFSKGGPVEVVIGSLQPNTRYFYQFRAAGIRNAEGAFHTQRAPGGAFTFTVTADPHLDDRVNAELYQRTLANALADAPERSDRRNAAVGHSYTIPAKPAPAR